MFGKMKLTPIRSQITASQMLRFFFLSPIVLSIVFYAGIWTLLPTKRFYISVNIAAVYTKTENVL